MISRRSVWIATFGLVLAEVIIGCQGTDLGTSSPVNTRPTGYGAHGIVPPLTITEPPATPTAHTPGVEETPRTRLTDTPTADSKGSTVGSGDGGVGRPAPNEGGDGGLDDLHKLHEAVMERAGQLDCYIARFKRRELLDGQELPEELIRVKWRKQPWSIELKWLRPENALGREVLYVKGRYDNK